MVKTFKHSGDLGDIIYALPMIKHLGGGILYLNVNKLGTNYCGMPTKFNQKGYDLIRPLLLEQSYIKDVKIYTGEDIDYDIDEFRQIQPLSKINLAKAPCIHFKIDPNIVNKKWLKVGVKDLPEGKDVIFARSPRYHGNFDWYRAVKGYKNRAVFVGIREEYDDFVKEFGCIETPFLETKDFLELAEYINGCKLFIGNQSCPFAISEGLHKHNILEVSKYSPNCNFEREGHNKWI